MNEIIQNLEVNATNGKENFCYISEKQLKAMKEFSKREAKESKQLKQKCKKQKEVIDKTIEFIKSKQCKYDGWEITVQLYEDEINQLLDILKEVSE